MNSKARGEKGQRIAIGELAKWDIDVAVPLTDNLPFDLVVIYQGKLFRAQVKSSSKGQKECEGSIAFKLTTSNWYNGDYKKYTKQDCDIMILCDYQGVYLLAPSDFANRRCFVIRQQVSRNGQTKGCNMHDDYVISAKRIQEVFV